MESHGDLVASRSSSPGRQKLEIRLRDLVNPRHTAPGPQVVASCSFKVNDSQFWNGEKHKSINCQIPGKKGTVICLEVIIHDHLLSISDAFNLCLRNL